MNVNEYKSFGDKCIEFLFTGANAYGNIQYASFSEMQIGLRDF